MLTDNFLQNAAVMSTCISSIRLCICKDTGADKLRGRLY